MRNKAAVIIAATILAMSFSGCANLAAGPEQAGQNEPGTAKAEQAGENGTISGKDQEQAAPDDAQDGAGVQKAGSREDAAEDSKDVAENEPAEGKVTAELTPLRDVVASAEGLGEDAIIGTCLGTAGYTDEKLMEIVEKHYNAITLENELKPDALFGYNNNAPAPGSIHEEEFDGKPLLVPTLNYSRADAILDRIIEYNEANPDRPIKVRGHVLMWHQQTPEWFFCEGYDRKNDYVHVSEMERRLEWYIKSVLEYYTGPGSKYNGLFYAWDVVNEAVSDRLGEYRSGEESNWRRVYGSNDFIISAFRYANKYAPPELDLYYNDYNECDSAKKKGIITLIEDVKAAEGTRIDGFGMQGHYTVNSPVAEKIDEAAREYAQHVDKVMITELDTKVSMLFNGNEDELPDEYRRQAVYLKKVYDVCKGLRADGIDFRGITFWGAVDSYSWLQTQSSIGGGSSKKVTQCPLLFDGEYKAKPAYYAFIDPDFKMEKQ